MQFIDFGPGGQNVTMGSQTLTWDGVTNLTAYGVISGTAGQTTIVRPVGWGHTGWCLIHQSQGTGAGQWEINWIDFNAQSTRYPLTYTYGTGAQVVTLSNGYLAYNNLTINGTVTAPAWNGSTGGIATFLCRGTFTVNSSCSVSVSNSGFRGGAKQPVDGQSAFCGEGTAGASFQNTVDGRANGNGGGGFFWTSSRSAGGGNATQGESKGASVGGAAVGNASLTNITFGGGGGGGYSISGAVGGIGGGIIMVFADNIIISGGLVSNGQAGGNASVGGQGAGGGAGGSVLMKCRTAILGTNLITVASGAGGTVSGNASGAGSVGRIHLDYYSSYSGSTTPTIDVTQDLNLKSITYTGMV